MTTAPMTALQWTDIAHIKDIGNISSNDHECLEEIRDVLARHNRLNKFGIALLHHHFNLHDTEVLIKSVDPYGRTLSSAPVARSKINWATVMETLWRFGPNVGEVQAMAGCDPDPFHILTGSSPTHRLHRPHHLHQPHRSAVPVTFTSPITFTVPVTFAIPRRVRRRRCSMSSNPRTTEGGFAVGKMGPVN